jgi:acylphosphatase
VKNLRDGRVEVVCEGKEEALRKFLGKLADEFKGYIRDAAVEWSVASGEFSDFEIRLYH